MVRRAFGLTILLLAAGSAGGAAGLTAQQAGAKLAYINSRAVLDATPGYPQADSAFGREREAARLEVERLQATLDSASADFDQKSVMLSPTARTARRHELEAQQESLQHRAAELQDRLVTRERELLEPIHSRVNLVIDGIRAEGNYAMIFDVSSNDGLIVSADKSLDLTQKVIDRLTAKP
jgi:Skp family chaperone for outer membrane proteins